MGYRYTYILQTLLEDLAQLLVAKLLHLVPEVQDDLLHGQEGGLLVDHHRWQVSSFQRGVHGLACLQRGLAGKQKLLVDDVPLYILVLSPLSPVDSRCGPRTEPGLSSRCPSSSELGFQPPGCRPPPPPGPSSQRWPGPVAPPPAPAAAPLSAVAPAAPSRRPAAPGPLSAAV